MCNKFIVVGLPIKLEAMMSSFVSTIISGSLEIGTQTSVDTPWAREVEKNYFCVKWQGTELLIIDIH